MSEIYYEGQSFQNLRFEDRCLEELLFTDCIFTNCVLENCRLYKCIFSNCTFRSCRIISPEAEYSQIKQADFTECSLVGVNWSRLLPAGKFAEPLRRLQNCQLKYNTFSEMTLRKFPFTGSEITASLFSECVLTESNFRACPLDGTEFFRCDLRKTDFREASGYEIDLPSSKLKGAHFSFPEVLNLLNGLGITID